MPYFIVGAFALAVIWIVLERCGCRIIDGHGLGVNWMIARYFFNGNGTSLAIHGKWLRQAKTGTVLLIALFIGIGEELYF